MENNYPPIVQVDEYGNIIGPISYESAHPKNPNNLGIRHLTSNIFIFEDDSYSRLLLTRRAKGVNREGVLNVCVGGNAIWLVQESRAQSPLEAAISELDEVFHNISIPSIGLKELTGFPKNLRKNDPEYVYLFEGIHRGPFSLDRKETSEAFFTDYDKLVRDVQQNSDKYVGSARLYLEKLQEARK